MDQRAERKNLQRPKRVNALSINSSEIRREEIERGRFSIFQKIAVYAAAGGSILSGLALFAIRYFIVAPDEFSVYHTPSEPMWSLAHKLLVPFLIFAFGLIYLTHIHRHFKSTLPKVSGIMAVGFLTMMIVSGYLLDFFADEKIETILEWIHTGSGLAFSLIFILHAALGIHFKHSEGL